MQAMTSADIGIDNGNNDNEQLLTFMMSQEEYGVAILSVQEIRGWTQPTPIPNAPDYVRGVTNLRGTIVPIVDLRCRLGMPDAKPGPTTVIIVVRVHTSGKDRIVGLVVDAVSDVYTVLPEDFKPAPDFGPGQTDYTKGIVTLEDKMIIILNLDRIIQNAEVAAQEGAT